MTPQESITHKNPRAFSPTIGSGAKGSRILCVATLFLMGACGSVDHDQIDEWATVKGGGAKMLKVVCDAGSTDALTAHAARILLMRGGDSADGVLACLKKLSAEKLQTSMAILAKSLWSKARFEGKKVTSTNVGAKDSLFRVRSFATDATLDFIDDHLLSWYADSIYEKLATLGKVRGGQVMQALGPKASERLITELMAIYYTKPKNKRVPKVGDQLLLGVASTGTREAVRKLLKIVTTDYEYDPSLGERAMQALWTAFAAPETERRYPAANGASLAPFVAAIVDIGVNQGGDVGNMAIELVAAAKMPACLDGYVKLMGEYPDLGASHAMKCGGLKAILPVAEALKDARSYLAEDLRSNYWWEAAKLTPKEEVAKLAGKLLVSKSRWARVSGIEILGEIKVEDHKYIKLIQALTRDKTKLPGFFEGGRAPRISDRAKKVVRALEKLLKDR